MKTRTSHIALCSLICLALLATFSTGSAQVPVGPTLPQKVVEAPALQDAPLRQGALEQPSQGKGFVPPPMDLSHLTGQKMPLGESGLRRCQTVGIGVLTGRSHR